MKIQINSYFIQLIMSNVQPTAENPQHKNNIGNVIIEKIYLKVLLNKLNSKPQVAFNSK